MMPVPHEIHIADLNQVNGWKAHAIVPCASNAKPASFGMVLERVKGSIKIKASPFTTTNLAEWHCA
jgi:hypothetical protein